MRLIVLTYSCSVVGEERGGARCRRDLTSALLNSCIYGVRTCLSSLAEAVATYNNGVTRDTVVTESALTAHSLDCSLCAHVRSKCLHVCANSYCNWQTL